MDLSLSSRFKNAWNAFRNRAPTMMSQNIGSGYSYRPDRFRLTRGNERSIVTSVYNRIALDVTTTETLFGILDSIRVRITSTTISMCRMSSAS